MGEFTAAGFSHSTQTGDHLLLGRAAEAAQNYPLALQQYRQALQMQPNSIAIVGDLVVHPVPYVYDGYPSEWTETLRRLVELNAATIVPGHGPVMHDSTYLSLLRELFASACTQVNDALRKTGPAMFRTVDDIESAVDLTSFRRRFAGNDAALAAEFDRATAQVIRVVFREASLR